MKFLNWKRIKSHNICLHKQAHIVFLLVHNDISGPTPNLSINNHQYFLALIDEYTWFGFRTRSISTIKTSVSEGNPSISNIR